MRRTYLSMVIPSVFLFAGTIAVVAIAQANIGRDFLVATTQILSTNPGFFPSMPSITSFGTLFLIPMMIANNPLAQFLIMIGVVGAVLATTVYAWLIVTREFFAWSFDRLIPAKFAEVNDRTHTPVFNIAVNGIIACAFAVVVAYFSSYIAYAFVALFALAVVSIAILMLSAIVLPLRKDICADSPANKYKLAGIPVISIAGVIGLVFQVGATYYYVVTSALGWGVQASELLVTVMVIPFVLYWVIRRIRRSQGIAVDLIFRTIPPE